MMELSLFGGAQFWGAPCFDDDEVVKHGDDQDAVCMYAWGSPPLLALSSVLIVK